MNRGRKLKIVGSVGSVELLFRMSINLRAVRQCDFRHFLAVCFCVEVQFREFTSLVIHW